MREELGSEAGRLLMAFANSHNLSPCAEPEGERPPQRKKAKGADKAQASEGSKPKRGGNSSGPKRASASKAKEDRQDEISRLRGDNSTLRGKLNDSQEQVFSPHFPEDGKGTTRRAPTVTL